MANNIITLTTVGFERVMEKTSGVVVVDFWAAWCMPCRMFAPLFEDLAEEYSGKALFGKVNIDEEIELTAKFKIALIPTIIVFKDGEIVYRSHDVPTKEELKSIFNKLL